MLVRFCYRKYDAKYLAECETGCQCEIEFPCLAYENILSIQCINKFIRHIYRIDVYISLYTICQG